jgi:prephenate dehydratase
MFKFNLLYAGLPGAFAQEAARRLSQKYDLQAQLCPLTDFRSLFEEVSREKSNLAVIPVENSLAGSVIENYDLLWRHPVWIRGEVVLTISHQVLVNPGARWSQLRRLYSHPKALEQCQKLVVANPQIQTEPVRNTAVAAQMVRDSGSREVAAIASSESARVYDLEVLRREVQDEANNWTRFVMFSGRYSYFRATKVTKASLAYTLWKEKRGTLGYSLEPFFERGINVTNLESRPIPGKFFEYIFYVDVEFWPDQIAEFELARQEVSRRCEEFSVLGVYG